MPWYSCRFTQILEPVKNCFLILRALTNEGMSFGKWRWCCYCNYIASEKHPKFYRLEVSFYKIWDIIGFCSCRMSFPRLWFFWFRGRRLLLPWSGLWYQRISQCHTTKIFYLGFKRMVCGFQPLENAINLSKTIWNHPKNKIWVNFQIDFDVSKSRFSL